MDWAQLPSRYYLAGALLRAGEPAEVLFTRALGYIYDQETQDGVIPREALPQLCPIRGAARAKALVREELWEVVPAGWRFRPGVVRIPDLEQLAAKRAAGTARQARHRRRNAVTHGVSDAASHALVTRTEVEVEEEAAAAAGRAAAAALPGPIDVLRSKLQAHTPLRALRFDTLTAEQTDRVLALLETHGDEPLVRLAVDTCRNPPPVHVGAFIGTWEALSPPGARHLGLVRQQLCATHRTVLSPSGACSACASDQKAAR